MSSVADHLWRVPFCLHVSHQEPVFGDQVRGVRLQSRGELRVRSCCEPVSDGHSQVLHRSPAPKLPGCVQSSLGSHQLQSWWIHRELQLHRRQVPGGWGQVNPPTGMKWNPQEFMCREKWLVYADVVSFVDLLQTVLLLRPFILLYVLHALPSRKYFFSFKNDLSPKFGLHVSARDYFNPDM